MIVPKKTRVQLYTQLFRDGVLTAAKSNVGSHSTGIANLHVLMLMKSLTSRGYVKEQFSWQSYYWFLTDAGIAYLREFLYLPSDIVPATLQAPTRPVDRQAPPSRQDMEDQQERRGGRDGGYRRSRGVEGARRGRGGPRGGDRDSKKGGDDFQPSFRG